MFEGTTAGVALEVRITPLAANSYAISVEGSGANLAGMTSPITVGLESNRSLTEHPLGRTSRRNAHAGFSSILALWVAYWLPMPTVGPNYELPGEVNLDAYPALSPLLGNFPWLPAALYGLAAF